MKVTFEIHSEVRGRWSIEQLFGPGDREKAIDEAKRRAGEKHVSAVRVIKEAYNPDTNESTEVVVYDTSRPARSAPPSAPKAAPASNKTDQGPDPRRAAQAKRGNSVASTAIMATGLVVAVAVLIIVFARGQQLLSGAGLG